MNYDIFIDESGLFIETSTDPADRIKQHWHKRKFPSQLAGVVCPSGRVTETGARGMVERSLSAAGIVPDHGFHCNQIKARNRRAFDEFVKLLVADLKAARIQPVRIVNEEGVSFGDRITNYTNVLAELLVRVCRKLAVDSPDGISLNVFAAKVRGDEDVKGVFAIFEEEEYLARIREYFARAAVANGWSGASAKWRLEKFKLISGKDDPRAWIADTISNASHDRFSTIGAEAHRSLQASLDGFDSTLSFNQTLQQVAELAGNRLSVGTSKGATYRRFKRGQRTLV